MMHSRHFVEDSPRTRIELARNNLRMQKELMKIEKQAKTAATNLSNNQQALRMSLRQLEGKRNSEPSPLLSRPATTDIEFAASKRKLGLFANNTSLTVESTADAYRHAAEAIPRGRSHTISSSGHSPENTERSSAENGGSSVTDIVITQADSNDDGVFPGATVAAQLKAADHQSPYISTPLNVRRVVRTKLSKPFHSLAASQHLPATAVKHHRPQESPLSQSCHTIRNLDNKSCNVSKGSDELNDIKASLKLPPINATRTVISAHHNTTGNHCSYTQLLWLLIYTVTDKATLKKASQLLGMSCNSGTRNDAPTPFQQFYKDAASSLIIVSPPATPCGERDGMEQSDSDDEQQADNTVQNADSNLSLSEMFEQIKKCRYIRHYYPNGEKPPEAWY